MIPNALGYFNARSRQTRKKLINEVLAGHIRKDVA
jgi:hypothetical protein